MHAIIRHGNKQFRVAPGDRITLRGESFKPGQAVEFANVLALVGEGKPRLGNACVGAKVTGEVVRAGRSPKIIVQHFRRREGYQKKRGHRQGEAVVKIKEIVAS
jgi:large subunit ribosomal protein L21